MYITHNNQTYANVRVYSTSGSVRFTGDSLSGVTELTGPVGVFADNGFQMQTYTPGGHPGRQLAADEYPAAGAAAGRGGTG